MDGWMDDYCVRDRPEICKWKTPNQIRLNNILRPNDQSGLSIRYHDDMRQGGHKKKVRFAPKPHRHTKTKVSKTIYPGKNSYYLYV